MPDLIPHYFNRLIHLIKELDQLKILEISKFIKEISTKDNFLFIAGNGGSASTGEHMATDLISLNHHLPLRVASLSENSAAITATGNDIGFDSIFSRQLTALARKGDGLIVISASGNSPNLVEAVVTARDLGLTTVGLLGFDGGKLLDLVDIYIHIKTNKGDYGPVEDMHLIINHILKECLASSNSG